MASSQNDELLKEAASYWWLLLLQGIAAVLIGWLLLSRPGSTTLVLVQFLGLYWLVAGVVDIVVAIADKDEEHRGLKLLGGLIGIIAGLVVLNNPIFTGILTPTILLWFIAFAFLINGIIKIFLGNKDAETGAQERSWGSFFAGLFYVIFGILLLGMPMMASAATVVFAAGILGIVGGIGMVIFSFRLKGATK